MKEPKAIAFVGDWHGNTFWGGQVISALPRHGVDTIVHVGDYGYKFTKTFLDDIETACVKAGVTLYFVDGNHDMHDWIWSHRTTPEGFYAITQHVRAIPRGHRWQWWGKTFLGLGGAHSVDRPDRVPNLEWWATEWITDEQIAKAISGGEIDVMVTHDCPSGVSIPGISRQEGLRYFPAQELDAADEHRIRLSLVADAVKPKLLVHGHYHVRYDAMRDDTHVVGLSLDGSSWKDNVWIVKSPAELA